MTDSRTLVAEGSSLPQRTRSIRLVENGGDFIDLDGRFSSEGVSLSIVVHAAGRPSTTHVDLYRHLCGGKGEACVEGAGHERGNAAVLLWQRQKGRKRSQTVTLRLEVQLLKSNQPKAVTMKYFPGRRMIELVDLDQTGSPRPGTRTLTFLGGRIDE